MYRGILDTNFIKTEMKIHQGKGRESAYKEGQITHIHGIINFGKLPK